MPPPERAQETHDEPRNQPVKTVSWREMWRTFGKIGLMSFGGPAAQIAVMHR